jgi:hypothetical protein
MKFVIEIKKELDGYMARVPAIKDCEVWAEEHEVALTKIINLLAYFLKLDQNFYYRLDITKNTKDFVQYTINIITNR